MEKSRVSAEIPVRWDLKGISCKVQLEVLLLQEEYPAGWIYVHKSIFKASKMLTGAGRSRTAGDSQRHHKNMLWKSSGGIGEGREGNQPLGHESLEGVETGKSGWEVRAAGGEGVVYQGCNKKPEFQVGEHWARLVTLKKGDTTCVPGRERSEVHRKGHHTQMCCV